MNENDIIGAIGVGLILIAYFGNTFRMIPRDGQLFFLLNIGGAGLACYASWRIGYWPFVILEGVWFLVSVLGWFRTLRRRSG
ncbi:MAG: hypothetical protein GC171_13830 [Terrimonas sp.]|nr:hypothetical protein [Terrimonas sp.]